MLIAHLPAGYLLSDRLAGRGPRRRALMVTGLIASVLPDTDLLWFYLVDGRQTLHHDFAFHWPLFWIAAVGLGWLVTRPFTAGATPFAGIALAGLMLHMILDSVAGGITWLAPFSPWSLRLVEVPATRDWWVWSFTLHWTFALELAILLCAALRLRARA